MAWNNAKPSSRVIQSSHNSPTRLRSWSFFGSSSLVNHLHCIFPCWKPDSDIQKMWIHLEWMYLESQGLESSKLDWICPFTQAIIETHWSRHVIHKTNYINILKFQFYPLPTLFFSYNYVFHSKYLYGINNFQLLTSCSLCGKYITYRTDKCVICHSYRIPKKSTDCWDWSTVIKTGLFLQCYIMHLPIKFA